MHYMVMYDISDSDTRERASRICLNYGLLRFQKSAFVGVLSRSTFNDLKESLRRIRIADGDDIRYIPLCSRCFELTAEENQSPFPELPRAIVA